MENWTLKTEKNRNRIKSYLAIDLYILETARPIRFVPGKFSVQLKNWHTSGFGTSKLLVLLNSYWVTRSSVSLLIQGNINEVHRKCNWTAMSGKVRQFTEEGFLFLLSHVCSLHLHLHLAHVHTIQLYSCQMWCPRLVLLLMQVFNRTFKRAKNCFSSLRGWLWRGAAAQLFCTLASRQRVWLHKAGLQLGKTDLLPFSVPQTAPATHSSVLALALRPLQNPSEVNPGNQTLRKLHGTERINFLVSERSELTRRKACRVP